MNARTREQRRREISQHRTRPVSHQRIYLSCSGQGEIVEIEQDKPVELCIEATTQQGEIVDWLNDQWWIDVHSVLGEQKVTIVILPTPGALFDSVMLHQLEMIRRIAHHWRLIGYALGASVQDYQDPERWIHSPYDEIRFCEDEVANLNGKTAIVHDIISQATKAPNLEGFHKSRVRLVPRFPQSWRTHQQSENSPTVPV